MSPPKLSIVIPSYNTGKFIDSTIKSILSQSYQDFECIVADGGSTDNTLDILNQYNGKIIWISEKDQGQSDAINKGMRIATGDIIAYINADDEYEPECFQKVVDFIENNPDIKWLYGKCRQINADGNGIRSLLDWYTHQLGKKYSYTKLLILDFISQPTVFWRREIVDEIGYFDVDDHMTMDYDYWLRIGAKYDAGIIDDYLAKFRVHSGAKTSDFLLHAKEGLYLSRRYAKSQNRKFLAPLQYLHQLSAILGYSVLRLFTIVTRRQN